MQVATAEAIDRRVITGITPNPPTTPVLMTRWGVECLTWGGYRSSQSSTINHQYTTLMSPNQGKKQLSVALQPSLDDWGEAITGCHSIGLRAPHQLRHQYWCSWWVHIIPVQYSSKRICDAHCYEQIYMMQFLSAPHS